MAGPLLDRLERRVTFVVGKGGVGKSTTAAGLALALADAGRPTHLLSTDPAHSLADILDEPPAPEPRAARCADGLTVEELDADRAVAQRMAGLSPALVELIDRGTYLDDDDAASLLDAALPGLDEIGAALRIAGLADGDVRLVVDTAPTGHTLRLLDVPSTLRGWARVFRAMAAKADAVATALVGRPVPLQAEGEIERLLETVDRFADVTRNADFVVVTAPGAVVAAETDRLVEALKGRGLRVAATVAIDRPGVDADVRLPVHPDPTGCRALREWWAAASAGAAGAAATGGLTPPADAHGPARAQASPPARAQPRPLRRGGAGLPPELDRGLVVLAGKGGVGKTTCAAAIASLRAETEPVDLLGVDPAGSLADVLPAPPEGLAVRELDAGGELERLKALYRAEVEEVLESVGLDRAARLDREVVESLWELAPPGIDELMALSRLTDEAPAGRALVLDTAPTGHFLRLVAMPELALDWTHRIMRILLKYRALGELDAPAGHLLRFAKRFRGLRERLADPTRTAIVIVTLDDPVVRAETRRLAARLTALGLAPAAAVVNRATGPVGPEMGVPTFAAPLITEPVGAHALAAFAGAWERAS